MCEGATPCDAGLVSEPSSRGQVCLSVCVSVCACARAEGTQAIALQPTQKLGECPGASSQRAGIRGPLAHLWKMEAGSSACTHTQALRPVERDKSPGGSGSGSTEFSASSGVGASPPYPLGSPVSSAWTAGLLSLAPFLSFSPSLASLAGHLPHGVTWTSRLLSLHLVSRPTPRLSLHLPRPSPVPSLLAPLSAFASISVSFQPGLLHSSCFFPCTCPPHNPEQLHWCPEDQES